MGGPYFISRFCHGLQSCRAQALLEIRSPVSCSSIPATVGEAQPCSPAISFSISLLLCSAVQLHCCCIPGAGLSQPFLINTKFSVGRNTERGGKKQVIHQNRTPTSVLWACALCLILWQEKNSELFFNTEKATLKSVISVYLVNIDDFFFHGNSLTCATWRGENCT